MARISVEILGRHLGTALASDEMTFQPFTVYTFEPAVGVNLPALCDLVIDLAHGWVIPIRGEGGGSVVYPGGSGSEFDTVIDLVDLLRTVPRQ
jgi:hypothetical protein